MLSTARHRPITKFQNNNLIRNTEHIIVTDFFSFKKKLIYEIHYLLVQMLYSQLRSLSVKEVSGPC